MGRDDVWFLIVSGHVLGKHVSEMLQFRRSAKSWPWRLESRKMGVCLGEMS